MHEHGKDRSACGRTARRLPHANGAGARTGAVTAVQKSEAIKLIDELLVEIKQARMRANETIVVNAKLGKDLLTLLMSPLKN